MHEHGLHAHARYAPTTQDAAPPEGPGSESSGRGRRPAVAFIGSVGSAALGLSLLSASPALADPTVTAVDLTAPASVSVGDPVPVALGLTGVEEVFAYEVTLTFDPALFTYSSGEATGPDGGFDATDGADGQVTLVHSRLGTSPGLAGDVSASVALIAVGDGTGTVSAAITAVDGGGAPLRLEAVSAPVVVAAAEPTQEPTEPEPSSPAPSTSAPGPAATTDPAPAAPETTAPTSTTGTAGVTVPGADPSTTQGGSRSLAATGSGVTALVLLAAGVVAAGVAVRRRARDAR